VPLLGLADFDSSCEPFAIPNGLGLRQRVARFRDTIRVIFPLVRDFQIDSEAASGLARGKHIL